MPEAVVYVGRIITACSCGITRDRATFGAAGASFTFSNGVPQDAPPIVAWHGIARNAADFATLGNALSQQFRIIAPDTIGRGFSQWSLDPATEYTVPFYVRLAQALR